jgi:hypothetical protein
VIARFNRHRLHHGCYIDSIDWAKAPDFALPDVVSGHTVSLSDFSDKAGVLVMFICNHCPYVKHVRDGLAQMGRDYAD